MNLAELLSYADIHELSKIAGNYNCECSSHSKNELIQSILSTIGRKDVFERQVSALSLEDVRFLNSILFDERNSFSVEELVARARQTKFSRTDQDDWNPRDMVQKFKMRGWLFNGYSHQTKYLLHMPHDLKRRFSEALAKQFLKDIRTVPVPEAYRDEQKMIVEDIYHFLHYVFHHDIVLTAGNSMYKRNLQQILGLLSVREEPVRKGEWRFGYGRMFKEYPNRFSLIYDYCYYKNLIAEPDGRVELTDKGRKAVLEGQKEDLLDVYRFWLRLYKGAIPNLQSLVHWVNQLTRQWVTAVSLGNVLCPLIKPFYYDSPESIFERRILQMMMHLGLIRIGEDPAHGKTVQVTKLGSTMIQGTYVAEDDLIRLPQNGGKPVDSSFFTS